MGLEQLESAYKKRERTSGIAKAWILPEQRASRLYDASQCDGEPQGLLQTDSSVRQLIK